MCDGISNIQCFSLSNLKEDVSGPPLGIRALHLWHNNREDIFSSRQQPHKACLLLNMTYGEEPGPETHQDSAVLTYLEGLLMHPVASGPGATATRRPEAGGNNGEAGNQGTRGIQIPNHGSSPPGAASQHLKKARLLRSGTWSEIDNQKKDLAAAQVNGQGKEHHRISLDNSAQGESTLLASLLQSFSSRLQTVAMSQNITQSHKQLDGESSDRSPTDKDTLQGYCTASSHLKGLIRKNKQQSHNTVPYSRRSSQDRCSQSPRSSQSSVPDRVSCAERLKAVASLVKSRSSPAPSPKPSVACSQLALLLSSEAHLQQYSQEQALKAQLCGRSASERLAAMATQQTKDNRPPSMGESVFAPDMLSPFNTLNGTLPSPTLNSSQRSPSLNLGQSAPSGSPRPSPHTPKEKRPFDRHSSRPPQNCSSLLLLLLNNHNSQKHLTKNGHLEDDFTAPPSQASSHQSDSEYSNPENSLTKDSSDAESCYSSCSPIDLSTRSRVSSQKSEPPSSASSLDKLTETLISKWKTETLRAKVPEARELEMIPDMTSHHKVTLMQLLLDRRNNEMVNKIAPLPDLPDDATLRKATVSPLNRLGTLEESRTQNPFDQLMGRGLSTSSLSGDTSKTPSPYSYSSPLVQSSPLNLCKSKQHASEKLVEPAFTASKLLQNLAQCGLQSVSPSPPLQACRPPSKRQSPEPDLDRSQTLLDRVAVPIKRNQTPLFEPPPATFSPFTGPERSPPAPTQIENLLERRTVLQLLLGSASHKEKSTERRSTEVATGVHEKPPGAYFLCDSSNGPSLNAMVKTEPRDEGLLSDGSDDAGRHCRSGRESQSPIVEAHSNVKEEAKYGLLSQLLKQKTTTYHSSPRTEQIVSTVKEEQQDYQVPLPKKRKLCLELAEHLSKELCQRPLDTVSECLVSGTPEAHNSRRLPSPKEEDLFIKSPASKVPTRDSQSFNVLKQLLLSDNCLKELSPPRGIPSPLLPQANCKANESFSQPSYNHELVNFPWFPQTLNSGPGRFNPLSSSPVNGIQGSAWDKASSPRPSPKSVKKETQSSQRWTLSGEDKCESSSDSPPLMRSNPILYYMLQRRNSQLRKEVEDHAQRTHCGVTVKVEPCANNRYYDARLSTISPVQIQRQGIEGEHLSGLLEKP
ncbi:nuclear receptor-interacting protein 1 [Ictalurus furcatus]|uniref:nuclear receptor-interacting protein 1 n=1 Tax=Ictalurus furcatus TaxID=66913 RepID=UPI0023508FD8|nr:nuclear receptor-interacting protein 1 [Ictalurus furcatus]XP_053501318.1 nuclear receptor-interacting protein 1 [Ictalurus furcatus]XP_053501319.1 nuclear receptor-interacting protein 1 [Ictalurus furcatus]